MESHPTTCDILIMGGGPSGSATATRLARKGYRTIVLEKDHHPRFHIGESLLPLSLPYLEELGILDAVDQIGVRKYAAEFHSPYHGRHVTFAFGEAMAGDYPYAYEVKRSEFDELLFRNAGAAGAELLEGWRVESAECSDHRIEAVTAVNSQGERRRLTARFFVDATGRDTFLADALGTKRKNPKHKSAALYAHYRGAQRNEGEAEGNISIYWFDKGWFWMIPLKGDIMSVGAVLKPDYLKLREGSVNDFMAETIAMAPGVAERLKAAERISDVTGTGNYSYQSTRIRGENYLIVGDAYAFIDPVFSSGVHLALHGGFLASDTIVSVLESPKTADKMMQRYESDTRKSLGQFAWFIYRVTTPAVRDLFMNPRDFFGMRRGIVSLLAGDLYRGTPIQGSLALFRLIYQIKALAIRLGLAPAVTP
jgi:flavin-dependent dehydrogenase